MRRAYNGALMTDPHALRRAQWQIHLCVLLWGFTAILGKLISLPALALVVWRMGLVSLVLAGWPQAWRGLRALPRRRLVSYALIGCLVALHWFTFYAAIKLSNASVAVACMALGAIFTALLEPLITRAPHRRHELLLGLLAIPGVWLLVGGVPLEMRAGIAVGTLSAALAATFTALNKRYVNEAPAESVTLFEMTIGGIFLILLGSLTFGAEQTLVIPSSADLLWLIVLAIACTAIPFVLSLHALRHLSAFSAQLAINLEPVYAIILAALWLGEYQQLSTQFYLGAAAILLVVFLQPRMAPQTSSRIDPSRIDPSRK
jgi:drug/metabolite transporter (DMT)-like permease